MSRAFRVILIVVGLLAGCQAPLAQLTFPYRPLIAGGAPQEFDVDRDGRNDFVVSFDDGGRVESLGYDDDENGSVDRIYRLSYYANERVPHVIVLLDSVPLHCVTERYAAGEFRWFDPPQKLIGPFASLTEVCYTELLHAPPMPGMIDQYYDRRRRAVHNGLWKRLTRGYAYPWERSLHYRATFNEEGLAYLNPRPWYAAELERARRALDESSDRTVVVYLTSASAMACKFGRDGIDEVLDGAAQLCLQLLYERRGALKISLMADHGHNLVASKNIDVARLLRGGGFRVTKRLDRADDVVLEVNGLVTYAAVRTTQPQRVADQLLTEAGVEHVMYMDGDRVIVRDHAGAAEIASEAGKLRYRPITSNVFKYADVPDEFLTREQWFARTVDDEYPDAPTRVWEAFHEQVVDPPEVMFTTRDGYCAGLSQFERMITMRSTHGSLNRLNTATFLMTMTGRAKQPMRLRDVLPTIEPAWRPGVVRP